MNDDSSRREQPAGTPGRMERFMGGLRTLGRKLSVFRHRYDLLLLAALVVLAAGAFGFAELAEVVTEGEAQTVDERLLLVFRNADDLNDPVGGAGVEEAVRDLTALGGTLLTTLLTLLVVGYFVLDRRPRAAAFLMGAVAGGVAVTFALKLGFDRPRPDLVAHAMQTLSPSFPSGHATTAAVVYLTLGALLARVLPQRRLKMYVVAITIGVTLSVGVSRIYLGVHWPTDVLAGWTLGAAWALACWFLERDFRRRGWIEPSPVLVRRPRSRDPQSPIRAAREVTETQPGKR